MIVNIEKEQLLPLIQAFYDLSGIKIAVYDTSFTEILAYPSGHGPLCQMIQGREDLRAKCEACAAKSFQKCAAAMQTLIYKCHAGLTEVAAPLTDNNAVIGYVIYGQITNEADREFFTGDVLSRCQSYNLNLEEVRQSARNIRYYSDLQLQSTLPIINALTSYIALKRLVYASEKPFSLQLMEYISGHLSEDLSVPALCRIFAMSRTQLYNGTRMYMPEGVAKYVKIRRIEAAKENLRNHPDKPVWKVAEECGFSNYDYFLRSFKEYTGLSASIFQKQRK